jgi:hypothetical protein
MIYHLEDSDFDWFCGFIYANSLLFPVGDDVDKCASRSFQI